MNKIKVVIALLSLFVTTPIWYFLMYSILVRVQATDVMWLLFWVYVPFSFLILLLTKWVMDSGKK